MGRKYAVLVHPGSWDYALINWGLMCALPLWMAEGLNCLGFAKKLSNATGLAASHDLTEGLFLSINLTSDQVSRLPERTVFKKVFKAGRLAEKLGARIVGVGALSPAAAGNGVALARQLKIAVTTGYSYAMAAVLEGSRKIMELMGVELEEANVMVLGAAGSPGATCARLLAREGVNYLTLADADQHRLDILAQRIFFDYGVSCKVTSQIKKSSKRADLIIIAGGIPELLLLIEDFKPGAVVYELPGLQSSFFLQAQNRRDILVINESVIEAPGKLTDNIDPGIPSNTVPANMVEVMLLSLEGRFENYTLGRELRIDKIEEIRRLAVKHGFRPAGYRSFGRYISDKDIRSIKDHLLRGKSPETQLLPSGSAG